jgi:hypothetical protein
MRLTPGAAARAAKLLTATGLILLLAGVAGLAAWRLQGGSLVTVRQDAVAPALAGDALLVKPVQFNDLNPGQVISYAAPDAPAVVSGRLVTVDSQTGLTVTANGGKKEAIAADWLVGRATYIMPKFGYVLDFLRRPLGIAAAWAAAAAGLSWETRHLIMALKQKPAKMLDYNYATYQKPKEKTRRLRLYRQPEP